MRRIILLLVLLFISIGSQQSFAKNTPLVKDVPTTIVGCSISSNPELAEVLRPLIEKMGINVEEIELLEEQRAKSCTVRIRGTIDGKEVDITITIEGKSCAELLKDIM